MVRAVDIWLIASSLLIAGGWVLSILHQLNLPGYLAWLLLTGLVLVGWWRRCELTRSWCPRRRTWRRLRRRFSRPLPLLCLGLTLLALGGGFLYAPNNYDALTYRVPRMLNWVAEGRWHWIHTENVRLNNRTCGFEWLAMPLLVLAKTDRAFFLINSVSFALLPGLIYTLFTRLSVRRRVAWCWMWLLPSGYCFLLQAGSIANDMFATPYALAALDYALRSRRSQRTADAWLSVLAAALMTGAKITNLPLLLPWMAALAPSWRLLLAARWRVPFLATFAALVSFLPTAAINYHHYGEWSGTVVEAGSLHLPSPVELAGLALLLLWRNFMPPILPLAGWWNVHALDHLPEHFRDSLKRSFGPNFHRLSELPLEGSGGLGFGLTVLTAISLIWAWRLARQAPALEVGRPNDTPFSRPWSFLMVVLPWVSLLAYLATLGADLRLLTPCLIFLFPLLLWPAGHVLVVRQRWWQHTSKAVLLLAAVPLVLNPARPLWPARATLALLRQSTPDSRLLERANTVYLINSCRHDAFAPLRNLLLPQARCIGFRMFGYYNYPETSLWRPFGKRRVLHVLPGDTVTDLRRQGIEYVVLSPGLPEKSHTALEEWLKRYEAEVVAKVTFTCLASEPPRTWYLARLAP